MKSKRKVLLAITINQHAYYRGIVRFAREHDWHLVTDMMYTGRIPLGWRGDGILTILGYRKELGDFILSAGVPAVAITLINDKVRLPRIEGDNIRIGELAAEHFLERGYRHFAWAPFFNDLMNEERFAGFSRTLKQRGFTCRALPVAHNLTNRVWHENWAERRRRLVRELKDLSRPTAVFAYNDCVAVDLIDACRDADLLVPEEIAVLGVDNDPDVCDCAPVPLSSVMHDLEGMAFEGAALLDRMMDGSRERSDITRIPPKGIVTRVSTDISAVANLRVAIALHYISDHFQNSLLSVSDVAEATGLSRRQLERLFRQELGCTINERIIQTRLQYAKLQLRESQEKIGDIARQAGFALPAHLYRTFRKSVGMSPGSYRIAS
jgi:LacI family transcriptional regulator